MFDFFLKVADIG